MIGLRFLNKIDKRLREIFPEKANHEFGGISMLLAGDLRQLPPVLDKPLYAGNEKLDEETKRGRLLYQQFDRDSYQLVELMRQRGAENQEFRDQLERLANGEFTTNDWLSWQNQDFNSMSEEQQREFEDSAITLASLKKSLVQYNSSRLRALGNPIHKIEMYYDM